MKPTVLFSTAALFLATTLVAADSNPKDEITAAAKKLGDAANYSWRTTVAVPEDAPFKPGPTEGKTEKDGVTLLSITFGDNETKAVLKDDKGAASTPRAPGSRWTSWPTPRGRAVSWDLCCATSKPPPRRPLSWPPSAKISKKMAMPMPAT